MLAVVRQGANLRQIHIARVRLVTMGQISKAKCKLLLASCRKHRGAELSEQLSGTTSAINERAAKQHPGITSEVLYSKATVIRFTDEQTQVLPAPSQVYGHSKAAIGFAASSLPLARWCIPSLPLAGDAAQTAHDGAGDRR